VAPTFVVTGSVGDWNATAGAAFTQSVAASVPSLSCTQSDSYNVLVSWSQPSTWPGSTPYDVYLNGVKVGSTTGWYMAFTLGGNALAAAGVTTATTATVDVRKTGEAALLFERTIQTSFIWSSLVPSCGS
jgi:hypothetical protein